MMTFRRSEARRDDVELSWLNRISANIKRNGSSLRAIYNGVDRGDTGCEKILFMSVSKLMEGEWRRTREACAKSDIHNHSAGGTHEFSGSGKRVTTVAGQSVKTTVKHSQIIAIRALRIHQIQIRP
jgi:hypothetical protein